MREELVEIHALGPRGDGIATLDDGKNIFVGRAAKGDKLRVKVHKNKQGLIRGEILEVMSAGETRQDAPCPHYDLCGGCQLQHIEDKAYKHWKTDLVEQALDARDVDVETFLEPISVPAQTRRRTNWAVLVQNNQVIIGYNQQRSHKIVAVDECMILSPELNQIKDQIKPYLKIILRGGRRANVFVQMADGLSEMVITGELSSKRGVMELAIMEAVAEMAQKLNIARISWRLKDSHTPNVMIERQSFVKKFGRLSVAMPPGAFMQPSEAGENALVHAVMQGIEKFGKDKKIRMADLFAGSGCFAGHMAEKGAVDAFEFAEEPIQNLMKAGGGHGVSAFERNLFERPLVPKELNVYDVVVFDPPRAGAKEQVEQLSASDVPLVIGVSCNPRSFARDAEELSYGGYTLQSVQCVDQFIYSSHIEVVGVFTKGKR